MVERWVHWLPDYTLCLLKAQAGLTCLVSCFLFWFWESEPHAYLCPIFLLGPYITACAFQTSVLTVIFGGIWLTQARIVFRRSQGSLQCRGVVAQGPLGVLQVQGRRG